MAMELMREPEGLPQVWQPAQTEEAWLLKRKLGDAAEYVSGGTLLRTQWENEAKPLPRHMISLESIREMRGVRLSGGKVSIGALTTLGECGDSELLRRECGILGEAIDRIAAPAVRNRGTIGGNVASLVGDALPALLALGAEIIVYRDGGWSNVSLLDWVHGARQARRQDDLVCRVLIAQKNESNESDERGGTSFAFYDKLGRREGFTPSLVTIAGAGSVADDGSIGEVRLSAGGGTALPDRLTDAEAALGGTMLSDDTLKLVHELIRKQYNAAEDLFAGSEYRKEASANMITARLWKLMKS